MKINALLFLVLLSFATWAQEQQLRPFSKGSLWGYQNKAGEIVIQPQYNFANDFEGEVARVIINKKMGLINRKGEVVVPLKYFPFSEFVNELAAVKEFNTFGLMNKKGEWVIPSTYASIVVNQGGKFIFCRNSVREISLYDWNGKLYLKTPYHSLNLLPSGNMVAGKNRKYGMIDKEGELILPLEFDRLGAHPSGVSVAEKERNFQVQIVQDSSIQENPWEDDDFDPKQTVDLEAGIITVHIGPLKYMEMQSYGLTEQSHPKEVALKGLVSDMGEVLLPCAHAEIRRMQNDSVWLVDNFGKWAIYSNEGKAVTPFKYDNLEYFHEGFTIARIDKKYGLLNAKGEVTVPFYDQVNRPTEGLVGVAKEYKWGFLDTQGKSITPISYQNITNFNEGRAAVMKDDKWGLIDTTGQEVLAPTYYQINAFKNGKAIVYGNDRKYGVIDLNGKEIIKPISDSPNIKFEQGVAMISHNRFKGLVDENGEILLPFIYNELRPFRDGLAKITFVEEAGVVKTGYVNRKGEIVIPIQYKYGEDFRDGTARVNTFDGESFYINTKGERLD